MQQFADSRPTVEQNSF